MPDVGDIKQTLLTKIGPLPAIAWGGILGGTFVVYRYYKASKAPSTNGAGITDQGYLGTANDFSQGFGNTTPGLGSQSGTAVNGPSGTDYTPSDNLQWGKLAIDWLISQGIDPADAEYAISTFLYQIPGNYLNDVQSAAFRMALKHFGNPPEGALPPPPTTPAPAPSPTPSPAPTPTPTPAPTTPSVSPEAAAAFARAAGSFHAAQDLANLFNGPIQGPHGIWVQPHQLASSANWDPFDQALVDQNRAQQVANYIHAAVWGPNGLVQPQ